MNALTDTISRSNNVSIEMMSALLNEYDAFCNNRRAHKIDLLKQFKELLDQQRQEKRTHIDRLLQDAKPLVEFFIEDRKNKELDFNVFKALGVTRKEVIQSRFLAYLLSPKEYHYQGAKFLNAFLALINFEPIPAEKSGRIRVSTEHPAGKDSAGEDLGRMDIVIDYRPEWLIVIENKIDAGEGDQQLPRYQKWLEKQDKVRQKPLIFLTPTGHEAVSAERESYKTLSYLAIAKKFEELLPQIKPDSVKTVICQYISVCNLIGGVDMDSPDEKLIELLTKPENLRAALELEKQVKLARMQVAKNFVESIAAILNRKISNTQDQDIKKNWESFSWTDGDGAAHVDIRTLRHRRKPNYCLRAESVFTTGDKGWYGWRRPQWVDIKQQQETAILTERMKNDGYVGADYLWVASRNLRNGAKGYVLTEIEDIISCIKDNRSDDNPLATEIAEEMWDVFIAYRPDIEALEGFKQADSNL